MGFPGGSDGKESSSNAGVPSSISGAESPLEKGMAAHSSIFAWRIPWTEEPGRIQSMGSQRIRHDWTNNTFTFQLKKYSGWLQYPGYRLKLQILEAIPRLKFWLWQLLISILGLLYHYVISSSHLKSRNKHVAYQIALLFYEFMERFFWETILCQEYTILGA